MTQLMFQMAIILLEIGAKVNIVLLNLIFLFSIIDWCI